MMVHRPVVSEYTAGSALPSASKSAGNGGIARTPKSGRRSDQVAAARQHDPPGPGGFLVYGRIAQSVAVVVRRHGRITGSAEAQNGCDAIAAARQHHSPVAAREIVNRRIGLGVAVEIGGDRSVRRVSKPGGRGHAIAGSGQLDAPRARFGSINRRIGLAVGVIIAAAVVGIDHIRRLAPPADG